MKCKLTYFAAIFMSIAFLSSCNLAEKNHYVSTEGDDSNSGSAKYPWETISYAVSQIKTGTLHIKAGVYKEAVNLTQSGTPDKPIIILGEEGAIIDGSFGYNYPGKGLFNIENASNIIVEGLTIRNVSTHGIAVQGDCNNIQIRSCKTEHTRGAGIYIYGEWPFAGYHIHDIIIENNEIHWPQEGFWDLNNIWHEDITLSGGIENFVIRSNYINAYDSLSKAVGPSGICIKSGARKGEIYDNVIENIPGTGIQLNAGESEIRSIRIYRNKIQKATNFGILLGAIDGGSIDSIQVCYNTIIQSCWAAIACSDYAKNTNHIQPKTNIDFFNNTIFGSGRNTCDGYGHGIWTQEAYEGSIYNNIIAGCADEGMLLGHPEKKVKNNCLFNQVNGYPGENAILADPQFVNPANFNFSLKSTSPCIDKGICNESTGLDVYSIGRPKGKTCDIGAIDTKYRPGKE